MQQRSLSLFFICVAVWSTTWLAIKFQLGSVAPEVSVGWRFGLAALATALICAWRGDSLRFTARAHAELIGLGLLMFCISYIFVYLAESHIVSGLVAVGYSASPLLNMLVARVAHKTPITSKVVLGGVLGICGVAGVFWHELVSLQNNHEVLLGALYTAIAVIVSSIANAFATRASELGLNVWQKMSWGMAYGALGCFAWAVWQGKSLMPLFTAPYLLSLLYLALAGSVLTFAAYFAFMARRGAARAGYIGVMTPIIALILSAIFEGFLFNYIAIMGILIAVLGNVLILKRS